MGGEPHFGIGDPFQLQYGFDTTYANRLQNPTKAGSTGGRRRTGTPRRAGTGTGTASRR